MKRVLTFIFIVFSFFLKAQNHYSVIRTDFRLTQSKLNGEYHSTISGISYQIGAEYAYKFMQDKRNPFFLSGGVNLYSLRSKNLYNMNFVSIPFYLNAEFGKKFKGDLGLGYGVAFCYNLKDQLQSKFENYNFNRFTSFVETRAGFKGKLKNNANLGFNIKCHFGFQTLLIARGVYGKWSEDEAFRSTYLGVGLFYEWPFKAIKRTEKL